MPRLVPVDAPLFISTISDLPSSSGLASSSCFAVGLLLLHILEVKRYHLVIKEEACQVEIDRIPLANKINMLLLLVA